MRTTLTIDDDVACLLQKENRTANEPMKQTVNRLLRAALSHAAKPKKLEPFVVKPIKGFQLPEQWNSGCVQELLDILDAPDAR